MNIIQQILLHIDCSPFTKRSLEINRYTFYKEKKCHFSAAALDEFMKERIKKVRYYKCSPDLCHLSAALVAEFVRRCKQTKCKVRTSPHSNNE